jgi:aerobic carbon-monoxide dehydrogenase medium subunit
LKPSPFEYHAPTTIDETVALLTEFGDDAKVLAGGQSLVPLLALRLASFGQLVDVGRIPALRGVHREGDTLVVGATTVDALIETSAEVASSVPLLARATPLIGHFQIRNRGTLGGSIAHADPAAEFPAVALALDAQIDAVSSRGPRRLPAGDFFRGFWSTQLEADELLVGVRFPLWIGRCGFAICEFARRHGDFAIAGAVVGVQLGADDRIERCSIGLLGLGPTPLRATAAENEVCGQKPDVAARDLGQLATAELSDVPSDLHGSARYRTRVGAAMVARAWTEAIGEATRV